MALRTQPITRHAVPFNKPHVTGEEFRYIQEAIDNGVLSGNGPFNRRCCEFLEEMLGTESVLLTHSCTGALEMTALLADVKPGDEVIMPSFTFTSTATAFVMQGATPVFVDIRPDTLCLDERLVEAAITERTRAIVAVHYAGISCAMDALNAIADRHGLMVIEDAAHGFAASVDGRPLGTLGAVGTLSFHETKNIICGEGGALIINDPELVERAEILHEKGTNRQAFFRGHVDKYSWVDIGSSFVMSELAAAFLWAQIQRGESITEQRLRIWDRYHDAFAGLEARGLVRRPVVPEGCRHNAHLYYLLLPSPQRRDDVLEAMARDGVAAIFHYVPLHSAPAGRQFGRTAGAGTSRRFERQGAELPVTEEASACLLRLPLWIDMDDELVQHVIASAHLAIGE
jgi:dTDP-4-amino-4,6-dideoxygalactose transaminase